MNQDVETPLTTELLILPDGQILVHNLTQPFAELLKTLNPDDEQISSRAADTGRVAQTSKPAVSRVSKPARRTTSNAPADLEIGDTAGLETCATARQVTNHESSKNEF